MLDSIRIEELAKFRYQFRNDKQNGLSEISHTGSIDESGIAILPPVLREHVPENETVQATTHRLVSTIDIPCDDEPRKMCGPLLASSPNGCGPGGHGMSNYSYPAQ